MNNRQESKFSSWIFNTFQVTEKGFGLYRIFAGLYILLFLLPPVDTYLFLSNLPSNFYSPPPGPFQLFTDFPSAWFFYSMYGAVIVALCSMTLGFFTKFSSLLTGVLLFILQGFLFGLGKVDHEILVILIPLLMAFSGWGKTYSIDAWRNRETTDVQNWVLPLLALIIGVMFFTAGFPKILGGWLDINTHATEGHFYKQYLVRGRQDLLANFALGFPDTLWEILDYATIIFEISFLAAIYKSVSTRVFICLAVFFHFSIMMIMNIPFLPNFLAYAAFFNWSWLVEKIEEAGKKWLSNDNVIKKSPPVILAGIMLVCFLVLYSLQNSLQFTSDLTIYAVILVSLFTLISAVYLWKLIFRAIVYRTD